MRHVAAVLPLLAGFLLLSLDARAVDMPASVVASGGGKASSTNYVQTGTVGQTAIGLTTSSSYTHVIGFWYIGTVWPTTGLADPSAVPVRFWLGHNYPNPFNPSTTLDYSLPELSHVSIKLYDVNGRDVMTIVDEQKHAGFHKVKLHASDLSSGIYFCRMVTSDFVQTKTVVLVK